MCRQLIRFCSWTRSSAASSNERISACALQLLIKRRITYLLIVRWLIRCEPKNWRRRFASKGGCYSVINFCQTASHVTILYIGSFALCFTYSSWLTLNDLKTWHLRSFGLNKSACFLLIYRVGQKTKPHTSTNVNRFSNYFHRHTLWKICNKLVTILIPPHLNCISTLPCEI